MENPSLADFTHLGKMYTKPVDLTQLVKFNASVQFIFQWRFQKIYT